MNARSHLLYNETCSNNNLLPQFTNVNVHDAATRPSGRIANFRSDLTVDEIDKQRKVICDTEKRVEEARSMLRTAARNELRFAAYMLVLKRITEKRETELNILHLKKIMRLYGDRILIKQERSSFINLSGKDIDDEVKQVFRLGMSCHIKNRPHPISKELEVDR